jgi:hypothetical protein
MFVACVQNMGKKCCKKNPNNETPNKSIICWAIVRDMGTFHGVNKCPLVTRHMVCDYLLNQQLDIDPKNEDVGILEMTSTIAQFRYANLGELID